MNLFISYKIIRNVAGIIPREIHTENDNNYRFEIEYKSVKFRPEVQLTV